MIELAIQEFVETILQRRIKAVEKAKVASLLETVTEEAAKKT